jgi:hypothetical protein
MGQHSSSPMAKDLLQTIAILIFSSAIASGMAKPTNGFVGLTEWVENRRSSVSASSFSVFRRLRTGKKPTRRSPASVCGASVSFKNWPHFFIEGDKIGIVCLWDTLDCGKEKRNGLCDNETRGEVNHPASGYGGAHQQLPVRETHR